RRTLLIDIDAVGTGVVHVVIGESRGEALDIGIAGLSRIDAVRAHESIDVVLVLHEGQGACLFGAKLLVENEFWLGRAEVTPARALPVLAQFPKLPEAVGVEFLDLVRPQGYGRRVLEAHHVVAERLEDMLWHPVER